MSEKIKPYNLEQAEKEAEDILDKIKSGEAEDYADAERRIEMKKTSRITSSEQEKAIDISAETKKQKEIALTPEQESIKENIVAHLTGLNVDVLLEKDRLLKNRKLLHLSETLIQPAVKEAVIKNLELGYIDRAILIKDKFELPEDFIQSDRAQSAVEEGIVNILCEGYYSKEQVVDKYKDPELKEKFGLRGDSENFISSAVKKSIVRSLADEEKLNYAIKIAKDFNSPDIIQSAEVQYAAEKRFIDYFTEKGVGGLSNIDDKDFYGAAKIKNAFELLISDLEIEKIIKMASTLSVGTDETLNEAFEIKNQFSSPLFNKISQELIVMEFENYISVGAPSAAFDIKNKFSLSEEDTRQHLIDGFVEFLSQGDIHDETYIEDAYKIKDAFSLSEETVKQIAKNCFFGILNNNKMKLDLKLILQSSSIMVFIWIFLQEK